MRYIENVVIGYPLVEESSIFSLSSLDWEEVESKKTHYTTERNLAKLLVEIGIAPSISEIRRNRREYCRELCAFDYLEVKWGKRRVFILVGSETEEDRDSRLRQIELEES